MLKGSTNSNATRDPRQLFTFTVRRRTDYVVRVVEVKDDNAPTKLVKQNEKFFDYTVQLWANTAGAAVRSLRNIIDEDRDTFVLDKESVVA
jgi:hypothetical protein